MLRDSCRAREQSAQVGLNISRGKNEGHGNHLALITTANGRCAGKHEVCGEIRHLGVWCLAMGMLGQISTLDWRGRRRSSDGLAACGSTARLASKLNWAFAPPSLSLQPYTPARLGRVQLDYVSSWTSFTSAT